MIRRPRTISTKLFVVTSLFLIGFLTLMVLVQTAYFDTYYIYKKTNGLREGLEALKLAGIRATDDPEQAALEIAERFPAFEQKYTASVAFGQALDGSLIMVPEPRKLIIHTAGEGGTAIEVPVRYAETADRRLLEMLDEWRGDAELVHRVLARNETVTFRSDSPGADVLNVVTAIDGTDYVLLASASLQPVGEAAGIAKDFYVYFLLLAIMLIVLLTYVFSRMISRPLVRLNRAAERLSRLDFTAEYDASSQDEIGNLGRTLRFLSRNLQDTLAQLSAANEKLKADIEKEKQLERQREQFVASVSHELKTPISLIGGYAEGLRDGIVRGERRDEYLNVIIEETVRMEKLVSDMLDLSQLRSGRYALRLQPFRIDELVRSLADKLDVTLRSRGIRCALDMREAEAPVIGDAFRIGQVLTNLLSNAIRHTPAGGRIAVSALAETRPDGTRAARIEVFNEGDAIPETELDHIWNAFHTVDQSHNRELGGSGVGLSVVRNILVLHGSSYGVRNADGGVVFTFTVNFAQTFT